MDLILPKETTKYVLFQRTAYLNIPNLKIYKILTSKGLLPGSFYNKLVSLEAALFSKKIRKLYNEDMQSEFDTLEKYLPEKCASILDVGCGIAGIDLFLNAHYREQNVKFFLLDKNEVNESVYYAYENKAAFYNSLDLAKMFLNVNGISNENINLLIANDNNEIAIEQKVDFVISLISWGFHYPVETYLDRIYDILNNEGILILDVRKGNKGLDMLKNKFSKVDIILDTNKYYRVRAVK